MAYVITAPCRGVKDGSCVDVCPVDCIHSDAASEQYFIDPYGCINCGVCVDVCPVGAIYPEDLAPATARDSIADNARYFGHAVAGPHEEDGPNSSRRL